MLTRDKSLCIKGIAILFMLFLHLFCYTQNVALCKNFIYIGDTPLVQILTRATYPVNFFLILGGYGLYTIYKKGDSHRLSRILKLYIHYWIILFIFLVIGHYINEQFYPGSLKRFLSNVTTYETTYNTEMWFLLPYSILSLTTRWWFKLVERYSSVILVIATFILHLITSYGISRHSDFFYSHYLLYNLWLVLHISFNFCLGVVAAKSQFFNVIYQHFIMITRINGGGYRIVFQYVPYIAMTLLIVLNCLFKYNYLYAFMMIGLLCLINFPKPLERFLIALGRQSMNMWMIHSWLCYYLFHSFIYSFKYPIIIFVVLTFLSYYIGTVIDKIAIPIEKKILNKQEMINKPMI